MSKNVPTRLAPEVVTADENWIQTPVDFDVLTKFEPLPTVAYITEEPRLPNLPVSLVLSSGLRLVELAYGAWIEYKDHGRNDKSAAIQGKVYSLDFSLDFGPLVMGGIAVLRVGAVVRAPNGQLSVLQNTFMSNVRGRNPSKEAIRTRLSQSELHVTAFRESTFRQFDSDGRPLFGPPRGFGIMQIDTPPATSEQLWNWKANVDAGRALWTVKARDAETYPSRVRAQGNPNATDFTPDELKYETYQRYNGGAYWRWDGADNRWVASPPNDYATKSIALETQVAAGQNPPGWL